MKRLTEHIGEDEDGRLVWSPSGEWDENEGPKDSFYPRIVNLEGRIVQELLQTLKDERKKIEKRQKSCSFLAEEWSDMEESYKDQILALQQSGLEALEQRDRAWQEQQKMEEKAQKQAAEFRRMKAEADRDAARMMLMLADAAVAWGTLLAKALPHPEEAT